MRPFVWSLYRKLKRVEGCRRTPTSGTRTPGEAIRLISHNLADPGQATSDATIGAVAILSASDNSVVSLIS